MRLTPQRHQVERGDEFDSFIRSRGTVQVSRMLKCSRGRVSMLRRGLALLSDNEYRTLRRAVATNAGTPKDPRGRKAIA